MSNYFTDRYNSFIRNANAIYGYLSDSYMNKYSDYIIPCSNFELCSDGMRFVEICRYRVLDNDVQTFENFKGTVQKLLATYHDSNYAAAYFIVSFNKTIHLFFATEDASINGLDALLLNSIPEIKTSNNFIARDIIVNCSNYNGISTGKFNIIKPCIDQIMDVMENEDCVLEIIAFPLESQFGQAYKKALNGLNGISTSFNSVDRTFGNASKTVVHKNFPEIEQLSEYLNSEIERIKGNTNSLWKTALWFGAKTEIQRNKLASAISGVFSESSESKFNKIHSYYTSDSPLKQGKLGLSLCDYYDGDIELDEVLKKGSLCSYTTTSELASLFQFPVRQHTGMDVVDRNITSHTVNPFSINMPGARDDAFEIGHEVTKGRPYAININDITEHMLVTGASGAGKTNTVWNIVESLALKNIPFCILESAKKEYWHLLNQIKDLKVYSPDNDALQLRFNPLEPEEGVIISDHIDSFMYAFSSGFEMEEPVKETTADLIRYTYEKFGWDENEVAYSKGKKYPFISDVLDNLYEYSGKEIKSGPEVKMNIEGAINRRLKRLCSGVMGRITNANGDEQFVTGKDLCNKNVLIELDSISGDIKPFITTMILIKISQYVRRLNSSDKLKNAIVLEEAHNVMPSTSNNKTASSIDFSSNYVSGLLSEVRDYGTGLIIVDQGASRINSNAVSNTKIKIAHSLSSETDVNAKAFSLGLNEFTKKYMRELSTGEALVSIRGETNTCKVNINKSKSTKTTHNFACLFCSNYKFCNLNCDIRNIAEKNIDRFNIVLSGILQHEFDVLFIQNEINNYLNSIGISDKDKVCTFGYMLAKTTFDVGERVKRELVFRYINGEV